MGRSNWRPGFQKIFLISRRNNMPDQLTIVDTPNGEWSFVYLNGKIVAEGEIELKRETRPDEWFEAHDEHLHETLEE